MIGTKKGESNLMSNLFADASDPKCVLCGEPLLERKYKNSDGTFFVCSNRECGAYYAVLSDGGIRLRRRAECPTCVDDDNKPVLVSEGFSRKDDSSYFRCKTCGEYFNYDEASGTLVRRMNKVRPEAPCPAHCGGKALQYERKDKSGVFWKCSNCEQFFDDKDGVPTIRKQKA